MPTYLGVKDLTLRSIMGVVITSELTDVQTSNWGGGGGNGSGSISVTGTVVAQYPNGGDVSFSHSFGHEGYIVQTYESATCRTQIIAHTRHNDKVTFHFPGECYETVLKVVLIGDPA